MLNIMTTMFACDLTPSLDLYADMWKSSQFQRLSGNVLPVADHRKNVVRPSESHKTQHYEKGGGKS